MTHFEKLDKLLMGLMSRVKHQMSGNSENPKLTFDFLCDVLLKDEGIEDWEKQFLQNRLMSDGFLSFDIVLDMFCVAFLWYLLWFFFFQAEDGIRDLVRSRGLGDVYKRQL